MHPSMAPPTCSFILVHRKIDVTYIHRHAIIYAPSQLKYFFSLIYSLSLSHSFSLSTIQLCVSSDYIVFSFHLLSDRSTTLIYSFFIERKSIYRTWNEHS
ncbi:hypothetical protein QVD17_11345 [Tagetes erecta]|uniref:Uncharacterized protein n=1 Tax=Tagetes erecta TaxID=13708 RepID=A0AAD8KU41_TARER|nr:hypothetical protein QVD17_11345 [Tagetes erecta]